MQDHMFILKINTQVLQIFLYFFPLRIRTTSGYLPVLGFVPNFRASENDKPDLIVIRSQRLRFRLTREHKLSQSTLPSLLWYLFFLTEVWVTSCWLCECPCENVSDVQVSALQKD